MPANLTIDRSTITDNTSTVQGGGAYNNTLGAMTITRSTIHDNTAGNAFAGGVGPTARP